MATTPSPSVAPRWTLAEQWARAQARAATEGLQAERIGRNAYEVPSLHLAPGHTWLVLTTTQSSLDNGRILYGVGYCGCPGFLHRGVCHHAGAVLNALDAEIDDSWEAGTAPSPVLPVAEPLPFPAPAYTDADRFELTAKGEAYLDGLQAPRSVA